MKETRAAGVHAGVPLPVSNRKEKTKQMLTRLVAILAAPLLLTAASHDAVQRIGTAQQVLDEIMAVPEKGIPRDLIDKAHCIVIVPGMKKGAFIVGAQYGKGVASCRGASPKRAWTGPSTVRLEGGSIGLQLGGDEVDLVLLVMNKTGADKLMSSKFTLGGTAEAVAGPVGRSVTAETDATMNAEILSWSRARGLFGGIALKGSTLRPDDDDNQSIYGRKVSHRDILTGKVPAPASAQGLISSLTRYSQREAGQPKTGDLRRARQPRAA